MKIEAEEIKMKFKLKKIPFFLAFALVLSILSTTVTAFASESKEAILWSDLPNRKIVFDKCINVVQMDNGSYKYTIEKNSSAKFLYNAYSINVYDADEGMTNIIDEVTEKVSFDIITYMDDPIMSGYMNETSVIKAGAVLKFTKPGHYFIWTSYGYASRDERLKIRESNETYSWQITPSIYVDVVGDAGEIAEPVKNKTETRNNATVKFTDWSELDNGHSIECVLSNNTDNLDTSDYALIFYSNENTRAEVHFLGAHQLKPKSSEIIYIHTQYSGGFALSENLKTIIVKFADEKQKQEFMSSIPYNYEINKNFGVDYGVDDGEAGDTWLKETFNITR